MKTTRQDLWNKTAAIVNELNRAGGEKGQWVRGKDWRGNIRLMRSKGDGDYVEILVGKKYVRCDELPDVQSLARMLEGYPN